MADFSIQSSFNTSEENSIFSFIQINPFNIPEDPENSNCSYGEKTSKMENNESHTTYTILKKGKRGRKRKSNIKQANEKERPEHNKYARDNIRRKIQINYLKFLRNFVNKIIDELGINDNSKICHFYPLSHKFSKEISKKYFILLKNSSIGNIFKENTTPKYKNYEQLNIKVYNNIINKNENIKQILDKKYLDFFDIYYKNIRQINLSDYGISGINNIINLSSDVELYEDLLKRELNKSNDKNDNDKYLKKIEKCINKDYDNSKPIFVVQKQNKNKFTYLIF